MITLIIGIFFWGMTAFVQINPQQQGLLYNLGKIESRQPLLPGIHIKLPWPIQTVKIYPAYKINSFTVGYESEQRGDYLWTAGHNGEEYKLLLGGGKELVSINMQVFYKIGDLYEYTLQYDNPEEKLKAEAYRILLNETVTTDLNKLLSLNRSSFSKIVALKLQQISKDQRLGIEVTDVALTSIHPPTEIAREYQKIVSADIQKKTIITNAESYADSAIPKAEKDRNELIKVSQVESISRKGQANSDAAKYTYQKNAYQLGPGIYKEWKWLEVLENTLSGKKLFLLDKNLNLRKGSIWLDIRQKTEKSETENKLGPEEYSDTLEGDVKSEDSK
jgi:membrane protease subunit HflK